MKRTQNWRCHTELRVLKLRLLIKFPQNHKIPNRFEKKLKNPNSLTVIQNLDPSKIPPQRKYQVQMAVEVMCRRFKKEINPFLHKLFQISEKEETFPDREDYCLANSHSFPLNSHSEGRLCTPLMSTLPRCFAVANAQKWHCSSNLILKK